MMPETTLNLKVVNRIKKLQASQNKNANRIEEQAQHEKVVQANLNFLINLPTIAMAIEEKVHAAWHHLDAELQKKWWEAIKVKFNITNQQVWNKVIKNFMPPNDSCMKCKWVSKIK